MKFDFSKVPNLTTWQALIAEEDELDSRKLASTSNTEPNEERIYIPKELYGDWNSCPRDAFPGDFKGIEDYAKDVGVWEALQKEIDKAEYRSVVSTDPIPLVSEIAVEISLKTHFDIVNLALKKTCPPRTTVIIANGKAAIKDVEEKEPDRASFLYNYEDDAKDSTRESLFAICDYDKNKLNENLVPGEVKVAYKFRMKFLTERTLHLKSGISTPARTKQEEAEKVFTHIYQYMNQVNAHYGYLITDYELICIRRRSKTDYGTMDLSNSIPLSAKEGKLNAKMALWYLHHRYVVHDPLQTKMPTTPKQRSWPQDVLDIINKRKRREDEEFKRASKKAHYQQNTVKENRSRKNLRSDAEFGSSDS